MESNATVAVPRIPLPAVLLALLLGLGFAIGAGLLSRAEAAPSSRWSTNLLANPGFEQGLAHWEKSPYRYGGTTHAVVVPGGHAASLPILNEGLSTADCAAVGVRQRIPIARQSLHHTLHLTWRMRVDGLPLRSAALAINVADGDRDVAIYTTYDQGVGRWHGAFQQAAASEWLGGSALFPVILDRPVDSITVDLLPLLNTRGGGCGAGLRLLLDSLQLRTVVVDEPQGRYRLPAPDGDGIAGAVDLINGYRRLAGSRPLALNPAASQPALAHARYMTATGVTTHFQDPASPAYTPEGDAAARQSVLCRGDRAPSSCAEALLTLPYHRVHLLGNDIGFGRWEIAAAFDHGSSVLRVLDGLGDAEARDRYRQVAVQQRAKRALLIWPPGGVSGVPERIVLRELPDPLELCPGAPADRVTGYPITIEVPFANSYTHLRDARAWLRDENGRHVRICGIDAQQPHPSLSGLIAPDLVPAGQPGTLIYIPLEPLKPATRYTFRLQAELDGRAGEWTVRFTTRGVPSLVP